MKTMNPLRYIFPSLGLVLLMLMLLQGMSPPEASAEQVWIPGHEEWAERFTDNWHVGSPPNASGAFITRWIDGHWEEENDPLDDTDEPIDTASGNNYFTEPRLQVPCPGIPLELTLKYDSLPNRLAGVFGAHWVHSYEWSLVVDSNAPPTKVTLFRGTVGPVTFVENSNGLYQAAVQNWSMETNAAGYTVHMPAGNEAVFDTSGRLDYVQNAWSNKVVCAYGTNGCLEAVTHSNGRKLVFHNSWDASNGVWRLDSVGVDGGATLAFKYGTDEQFTQVVEQVGLNCSTSSYFYDSYGYLTNRIDGAGVNYTYGYEQNGSANKCIHLDMNGYYDHDVAYNGNITDVTYHERGLNQVYRYSRTSNGRVEAQYGPASTNTATEALGIRYAYSTNGTDLTEMTLFEDFVYGTTTNSATWSQWMLYDDAHNVTNYAVSYCSTNPVQRYTLEYDPQWQLPSSIVEPDGSRTEIEYTNGLPQVVKTFWSTNESYDVSFAYTTNGLLWAITNANSHVLEFGYDSEGNNVSMYAQVGPSLTNSYDALGYLKRTETLSESGMFTGRIIQYGRDAKGRITSVTYPNGSSESFLYNALGAVTNFVDRAGRHTDMTYVPVVDYQSTTRYLNQGGSNVPVRVGYDFDQQMNLLRITEPRGRYVESYQLDLQDRLTAVTNIEGQVMALWYYDTVGDFVQFMDRFDGSSVIYGYDNAGQTTNITYVLDNGGASVDMSYYADGSLKTIADDTSSVSNTYDQLNRLTDVASSASSVSSAVDYQYDPVGNLTNSVVTVGGSQASATAYAYDTAERLKEISREGAEAQSFVYEYNPDNGGIASVSNTVSGIVCSYQYDLMDQVTNMVYRKSDGSVIRSLDYTYDSVGMIKRKTIGGAAGTTSVSSYTYDSIDRLVAETKKSAESSVPSVVNYQYDLAGNRTSKTTDNSTVINYQLGVGNRLVSSTNTIATNTLFVSGSSSELIGTDDRWGELWITNLTSGASVAPSVNGSDFYTTVPALAGQTNTIVAAIRDTAGNMGYVTNNYWVEESSGGTTSSSSYAYDAAGCLTNLNGTALHWDVRYRLTSVDGASSSVAYAYDVLGRRTSRTAGVSPADTEYYIYDGNQVVADLDGDGNLLRTYVWGTGIDNLLSMTAYPASTNSTSLTITSPTTFYAIKDHQNSVIAMADASGNVVESYDYDAYGNTTIRDASGNTLASSALGNRYMWQGREYDSATCLYYFRARWYDPENGRWISKDPVGMSGGLNLYEFCGDNPVNSIDPLGLLGSYYGPNNDVSSVSHQMILPLDNVPFHDQIDQDQWNSMSPAEQLGTYNTLSEINRHGFHPVGPVIPRGVGVLIPGGVDGNGDCSDESWPDDSPLAFFMKNFKDRGSDASSRHFPGSPSLNETQHSDGSPPFYDVDPTNPADSLSGHIGDAIKQMFGAPLTDQSYDSLRSQGLIDNPYW